MKTFKLTFLTLILAFVASVSLTSCGSGDGEEDEPKPKFELSDLDGSWSFESLEYEGNFITPDQICGFTDGALVDFPEWGFTNVNGTTKTGTLTNSCSGGNPSVEFTNVAVNVINETTADVSLLSGADVLRYKFRVDYSQIKSGTIKLTLIDKSASNGNTTVAALIADGSEFTLTR